MKKITLFAIAALSLALASCSKEQIQSEQESGRTFSMTLNASVNETKATMSDAWKFAFSTDDKISLTNNQVTGGTYYELTRGSDGNFTGTVTAPTAAADWYAYYPSHSVSLADQTGTKTGTAAYCALAGKQENVAADSKNLNISLSFQTAILVVDAQKGNIDINVKTSDGKYVSGFEAKANAATFDVTKSDTKVSLLNKSTIGTYYIVVPAGIKITVYDGETKIKETKEAGLTAGKYYNIIVPINTIGDVLSTVEGGFPLATGNRWTTGFEKYACIYNGTLLLQNQSVTFSLSTSVTKDGNCYTASVVSTSGNQGKLTFNMNNGILTNFEFKATDNAKVSFDGIYYAPPLPVKVVMNHDKVTDDGKYKLNITIKGSNITSCSYYLAEKTEINNATDLERLAENGTNLDTQQLKDINSSTGYVGHAENCETEKGYKIVLVVKTSDGKKTIVVGGYYCKSS